MALSASFLGFLVIFVSFLILVCTCLSLWFWFAFFCWLSSFSFLLLLLILFWLNLILRFKDFFKACFLEIMRVLRGLRGDLGVFIDLLSFLGVGVLG